MSAEDKSYLCDFHTHTSFCDGKDTPAALAERAYSLGFSSLGFSGHSYFFLDKDVTMTEEKERDYRAQVLSLREEYKGRMNILLGIEMDIYSEKSKHKYDYSIGSVHYVKRGDEYLAVDYSADNFKKTLDSYYGGELLGFARDYYSEVARLLSVTGADIIGHLDLITKFKDTLSLSLPKEYYKLAREAIDALIPYNKPFEINTGAMARGYRKEPYPDTVLLGYIKERGGSIILSGDCHDKNYLGFGFDEARWAAREAGFTSRLILDEGGFSEVKL